MSCLDEMIKRQGEIVIQSLLENWEKQQGIHYQSPPSLESRWEAFISETDDYPQLLVV